VAGTGTQGFAGDGGAAKSAQLAMPVRVVVGSNGNIYIADGLNHRIRMISNGSISTVAGNGTAGYAGDGSSATSAELNDPTGIALDSSGNLYIADAANQVVRKLPVAVAVDASGNIFIADAGNNVVRKVSGANISTVVGAAATTLQLSHPDGLAIDSTGALYIADTANRRIVKFVQGVPTVFAGNGTADFSGDGGPALQAGLGDPVGVGVDSAGNVYIADTFNSRIRRVSPTGTITTIAGDGVEAYFGDGGLATNAGVYFPHDVTADASGNIYIADTGNNTIRLLKPEPPSIFPNGVVNAARYAPKISAGALASIFGPSFASGNLGASLPLTTTLGGVSVSVNGKAAPILYVTPFQVNFQVPWETAVGSASITVTVNGRTSSAVNVAVLTAAPGLFVSASGRAVVQNAGGSTLNSATNPAKVGSTITAYLTGSGPVSPPVADGAPAPASPALLTSPVSATIGGQAATVSFAGLAPGFVGLVQLNIVVPSALATGDYPLLVTIAGETSNPGTISVTQ
jgi:uncharacterized protein (TIGR03437 family)